MGKNNDCWGIEVGANAIKAVRLQRRKDGLVLADFDVIPFKKPLTTPDLNVNEAIQVNLDQFLSKHTTNRSTVMVSVPGHMAFARFAKLPPVDPKRIPDIVRFEAVQQIPFPIEQVEWDYQVFQEPDSPDVEVGIFAITKDRVTNFLENYNAVGLGVDGITLSPLAVYNALAYDMQLTEESAGVVFMDIGTSSTDVIIVEGGRLWLRTLPVGGNNFTDALVRAFKLSLPKAEKLKRDASTSKYARQIFQAMRPVFSDLVQEMQRSLGFYQSLKRDAKLTKIVGVGSTFRLPGMSKFLKQQLQMDVVRLDSLQNIQMEGRIETDFAEHTMNMATAYGLALQGLELERVSANVLSKDILRNRFWRAKQPWMGAAALLMVAASGAAATRLMSDRTVFNNALEESKPKISGIVKRAEGYKNQWHEIATSSDPRQLIENLRRVLDYRDIWPKLIWDMDLASKAMKSQAALMSNNYDDIKKIPRRERRRLYFDKLEATYLFNPGEAGAAYASGTDGTTGSMSIEDIWNLGKNDGDEEATPEPEQQPNMGDMGGMGGMGDMPPGMGGGMLPGFGGDIDYSGGSFLMGASNVKAAPPRFTITVTGTTSYRGGARFISRNFIKWLRAHADRADRPYRIVKDTPDLVKLVPLLASTKTDSPRSAPEPLVRNRRRRPRAAMIDPDAMMMQGTGARTVTAGSETGLPTRPLADESRQGDYEFVVTWTIELIKPDDARRSEDKLRIERAKKREAERLRKEAAIKAAAARAAAKVAREAKETAQKESDGTGDSPDTNADKATTEPKQGGDQ